MPTEFIPLSAGMNTLSRPAASVSTGFPGLDEALGGGLFTGMTIAGGAPGMGQAELMLILAHNIAAHRPVLLFSSGERREDLIMRLISFRASHLADGSRIPGMPYVTVSMLSGLAERSGGEEASETDKRIEEAQAAVAELARRIFVQESTDCDIAAIAEEFLASDAARQSGELPVVLVSDLSLYRCGADNNSLKKFINAMSLFAKKQGICAAAGFTLDIGTGDRADKAAFEKRFPALLYADALIGIQSSAASWDSEHKPAGKNIRRLDMNVIKHRFGGEGGTAEFGISGAGAFPVPYIKRDIPGITLRTCYYNNSDLSSSVVFRAQSLFSEKAFGENDTRGRDMLCSLSADTSDGEPVRFPDDPDDEALFSYMDMVTADAVYSAVKRKHSADKIYIADIMNVMTGRSGSYITPSRADRYM